MVEAPKLASDESIDNDCPQGRNVDLEGILHLVREREGVDLCSYRRNTVERRVTSRIQKLRCRDYGEYASLLAEDPTESRQLVEHITIKVSRFFRDARVFKRLREDVLPDLVERAGPSRKDELRFWSAGCGNGEEAYSLAILVAEMARQGLAMPKVTIWGTDVDRAALAAARRGIYPKEALAEMPADLAERYFTEREGRFAPQFELNESLREKVRFVHQDLLSEATAPGGQPFDLVLCRNVLIYFVRPAQTQVLSRLFASLATGGYLCLGEAEQLGREHQAGFETIDRLCRLYRKLPPALKREK